MIKADSLIQLNTIPKDSLKILVLGKFEAVKNAEIAKSDLDFWKILLTAFIAAIITQLLIILIGWIKRKIDLNNKRKLIVTDLKAQKVVLLKLRTEYEELLEEFENKVDRPWLRSGHYEDLHVDVYQAVSKPELYLIFKDRLPVLVIVYKTIEFLKDNLAGHVFVKFHEDLKAHMKEKKDDSSHRPYCATHLNLIVIACERLKSNITSVDEVVAKIDIFIG